jgi:hypothetical protein
MPYVRESPPERSHEGLEQPRRVPDRRAADVLLGLQRTAGNAAVGRLLQRQFTPEQQADFVEINKLLSQGATDPGVLLARAEKLKGELKETADIEKLDKLIAKIQAPQKVVAKPAEKPWLWTPEQRNVALELAKLRQELFAKAKSVQGSYGEGGVELDAHPDDPKSETATVPVCDWEPDMAPAGLRLWAGMVDALRAVKYTNALHFVVFKVQGGPPVVVRISTHASEYAPMRGQPDYLVHDSRAQLVMATGMGIQQRKQTVAETAEWQKKGDTLTVNYEAFTLKLALLQKELGGAPDALLADWLLRIIQMPGAAAESIRRDSKLVTDHHITVLYELASTWMLAEGVRNRTSLITGVLELELIKRGQRKLHDSVMATHPMAHIGSEGQGRAAEQSEDNLLNAQVPLNRNLVNAKQESQVADLGGIKAVQQLLQQFTLAVEKAEALVVKEPVTQ